MTRFTESSISEAEGELGGGVCSAPNSPTDSVTLAAFRYPPLFAAQTRSLHAVRSNHIPITEYYRLVLWTSPALLRSIEAPTELVPPAVPGVVRLTLCDAPNPRRTRSNRPVLRLGPRV